MPTDNTSLGSPRELGVSRRQFTALASALATPALAGCSGDRPAGTPTGDDTGSAGNTPSPTPQKGGTLYTTLEAPIRHLDPHFTGQLAAHIVGNRIQEPLMKVNRDLQLEGLLAEDLSVSDDGLRYTIKLREGVMFQPPFKREMTADDVIFNFDRIAGENSASLWKLNFKGVKDYKAVDKYRIEIEMKEVHASFREWLGNMGINILSPEALEEYGDAKQHPVGTGPFKFEEWKSRDHIRLSGFDEYWKGDQPYLDELVFRPISEPSVKVAELQKGNIDIIRSTPPAYIKQLKNDESVQFTAQNSGGYTLLLINTSNVKKKGRADGTPTSNRKVRQAIQEAIDRPGMVDVAVGGYGRETQSWWPEESPWGINYAPYTMGPNPEKAKGLIEDAGFDTPVPVNIVSTSDNAEIKKVGRLLQSNLKKAGFDPKLNEYSIGTASAKLYSHQYDIYVNAVGYIVSPDIVYAFLNPNMIYQQPYDKNPNNKHEEVFELFERGDKTLNLEERKRIYKKAQKLMIDDSPQAVLYHPDHRRTYRKTVQNYDPHPFLLNYDLDQVWVND